MGKHFFLCGLVFTFSLTSILRGQSEFRPRPKEGAFYVLDIGTPKARPNLQSGFSYDETWGGTQRTFCWVEGTIGKVELERASRSPARLMVDALAFPMEGTKQTITAVLNGKKLGTRTLISDWTTISFLAPPQAWQIGKNELELQFAYAVSPKETGGKDSRKLSAAIDKISVTKPK